jgi:hypothetical protein
MQVLLPRSSVVEMMPLTFTTGATFATLVKAFLLKGFAKGVF